MYFLQILAMAYSELGGVRPLADLLEVSPATLTNYLNQKSFPHPAMQREMIRIITEALVPDETDVEITNVISMEEFKEKHGRV